LAELTARQVMLSRGGSIHDPTDPGRQAVVLRLAMVAEFEADLIRLRTREGMQVAKAKGRLRDKQPKLNLNRVKHLLDLQDLGTYTPTRSSLNCSASADRRSTAHWSGCVLLQLSPSGPSPILKAGNGPHATLMNSRRIPRGAWFLALS
jgi:hypothetical protein